MIHTAAITPSAPPGRTAATGTPTQIAGANDELGKDDFLRLLTTQLQHQDPMNPTEDMSFIGQMAQFSALEQTKNMATALDRFGTAQQIAQSIGLIGRSVEGEDAAGAPVSGLVDAVTITDTGTVLAVGSATVRPSSITSVK